MKKIILLLMLIPNIVLADVVYTEYEEYLRESSVYMEESDIIKREEYKIYNTYIEEIIEKYAKLEEQLEDYKIDYDDYIIEYENNLEKSIYTKSYEMKCLNEDYRIGDITLDNFSEDIKISELEIIFNNEVVPYGTRFTNSKGLSRFLFDKQIDDNTVTFKQQEGILYLSFLKRTLLNNITLKLHFPNQELDNISFNIKISNKYEQRVSINLEKNQSNVITINFDNNYNNFIFENDFLTNDKCIAYYYEEIPLYKHKKNNIIALNNYIQLNNYDLFLLEDYKIKYNYYKREKIEIEDNIFLSNTTFDIKDYIISSTIPIEDLKISHNIDYDNSGTYNLEIYYNNLLLIEKSIIYEKEHNKVESIPIVITQNEKEENIITTTKRITSKTTTKQSILETTKSSVNKITSISNIKMSNKQNILNQENTNQKTVFILVISILLFMLIIFEIILLYVKRKYY